MSSFRRRPVGIAGSGVYSAAGAHWSATEECGIYGVWSEWGVKRPSFLPEQQLHKPPPSLPSNPPVDAFEQLTLAEAEHLEAETNFEEAKAMLMEVEMLVLHKGKPRLVSAAVASQSTLRQSATASAPFSKRLTQI